LDTPPRPARWSYPGPLHLTMLPVTTGMRGSNNWKLIFATSSMYDSLSSAVHKHWVTISTCCTSLTSTRKTTGDGNDSELLWSDPYSSSEAYSTIKNLTAVTLLDSLVIFPTRAAISPARTSCQPSCQSYSIWNIFNVHAIRYALLMVVDMHPEQWW
jgi:hypothetical protein